MSRRYEFDRIRVYAILVVFVYHSTRFFNLSDWHVKNITTYTWVEGWTVFILTWLMPLFFTISGASLFFSITRTRGFSHFFSKKFLRLMVPVVVACISHGALQVYFERLSHGQFSGSFFAFWPEYFYGIYNGIGHQENFAFFGMHLWYLLFLFVYSLICYPLFVLFTREPGRLRKMITAVLAFPGLIYLLMPLPLILIRVMVPEGVLQAGAGGWGFVYYLFFLIAGFLMVSDRPLENTVKKNCWVSLMLGMISSGVYLYLLFNRVQIHSVVRVESLTVSMIYFFSAWCWILFTLGAGMRFLTRETPMLAKANEGVLPFYILHQSVLVVVGYFIMQAGISDILKWAICFTVSFSIIMITYLVLIRRLDFLRFLFGMKTTSPGFTPLFKKGAIAVSMLLFTGLIVFAIWNQKASRLPMAMTYTPETDIVLDHTAVDELSNNGAAIVDDPDTDSGRAIEFTDNESRQALASPETFARISFTAPAGSYTLWLRGESEKGVWSDSVWLQVDGQIQTGRGSFQMGNWQSIHPAGTYGWAGNSSNPVKIYLKFDGTHTLRIQPRQVPHRIDQIWLSKHQDRIPDTPGPVQ